jgi:Fe-S cluster biosynthesis and repair protein YggX
LERSLSVPKLTAASISMSNAQREPTIAWKSKRKMLANERRYSKFSASHIDPLRLFKKSMTKMLKK